MIAAHLLVAIGAAALGLTVLMLPKGTARHRAMGRVWAMMMLFVAGGSFWIRELNAPAMSWIHLLSAWTLVALAAGVWCIRRGNVRAHRGFMIGTYAGLIGAGVAALWPGRYIWTYLFS